MFHLQIFSRLTKAQITQDAATVILSSFTAKYLASMVSSYEAYDSLPKQTRIQHFKLAQPSFSKDLWKQCLRKLVVLPYPA